MIYKYPLQIRFKLLAFAPAMFVTDSENNEVAFIQQKVFALREAVKVFNNQQKEMQLYGIKTQEYIDFGARYSFYKGQNESSPIGSIKEEGLKTLFKATYVIFDTSNSPRYTIKETNSWVKVADYLVGFIPYVGLLVGYFLNPTYMLINTKTNKPEMLIKKVPSFFERQFVVEAIVKSMIPEDETICFLSCMMMVQLQKNRG